MILQPTPKFLKDIKALQKKYPTVANDLEAFAEKLQANPREGEPLGQNCYKVRFDIKAKNTGKRDNSRIITCVKIENDIIYFLAAYDKSEKATVKDKELTLLLKQI